MAIKKNRESVEMYLETILRLSLRKPEVHSIDVANEMGFSKPSVSVAMKNMREDGLITMDEMNHIHLTDKGQEVAESVFERHSVLTKLFEGLGVDPAIAEEDAGDVTVSHDMVYYESGQGSDYGEGAEADEHDE